MKKISSLLITAGILACSLNTSALAFQFYMCDSKGGCTHAGEGDNAPSIPTETAEDGTETPIADLTIYSCPDYYPTGLNSKSALKDDCTKTTAEDEAAAAEEAAA